MVCQDWEREGFVEGKRGLRGEGNSERRRGNREGEGERGLGCGRGGGEGDLRGGLSGWGTGEKACS